MYFYNSIPLSVVLYKNETSSLVLQEYMEAALKHGAE